MRKMSRHDTACTRKPPRKGPTAVPTPPSPAHAPMARARSSGDERRLHDGERPRREQRPAHALQGPGRDEDAGPSVATAHTSDASANHTTPITNTRRRPKRSPSDPPTSSSPARASR